MSLTVQSLGLVYLCICTAYCYHRVWRCGTFKL